MIDRVKELINATKALCPGHRKLLSIDNTSGKIFGQFYLVDSRDNSKLEIILNKFEDILVGYNVSERMDTNIIREDTALSRYEEIEHLVIDDLIRIAKDTKTQQENDAAYALVVWLDPEQGTCSYHISCQEAFSTALTKKRMASSAKHYASTEDMQNYRFYGYSTFDYDPNEALADIFFENAKRGYEYYEKYGEPALMAAGSNRLEFTTEAVARALNKSSETIKKYLQTTDDFMMLINYYDQDDVTNFRALRKTNTREQINASMGSLYADLSGYSIT